MQNVERSLLLQTPFPPFSRPLGLPIIFVLQKWSLNQQLPLLRCCTKKELLLQMHEF